MEDSPKHIFRPKARIMVLLGDQLIKNHTLALFELIKNSYDADASEVSVSLNNIDKANAVIEVMDDGIGMSYSTVNDIWLEPAHSHKSDSRAKGIRTAKGRLPVGEKGVGRFAVHRLGAKITMITRAQNEKEVVITIDWDDFLKNEYLDQSEIDIKTREPELFRDKTGTFIRISDVRHKWTRGDVRKLYRQVMSMSSPELLKEDKGEEKEDLPSSSDFKVDFEVSPNSKWLDDLFDPELAESQALFQFSFELNDDGLSYDYDFTPYEAIKSDTDNVIQDRSVSISNLKHIDFFTKLSPEDGFSSKSPGNRDVMPFLGKDKKEHKGKPVPGLGIGPIKGKIIAFDFDKEIYDTYLKDCSGGLINYVKEQGGIKVYRDSLRVYSYGEPGDDWLHLDHRRIQSPTKKLGSRQMIGATSLSLEESTQLIEKTNREGFVENKASNELVHAMLCILAQFEAERNKDKRFLKKVLSLPQGSKTVIDRKKTADELINELQKTVVADPAYKPIEKMVQEVSTAYTETRNALMSAAGAGMGLVTVFHELERGVRNLNQCIKDGLPINSLKSMSEELVSLLRGAMYMVNTKQMEKINASRLVEYVLLTQRRRFERHGITFLNGFKAAPNTDFEIKGIRRMLTTTLVNIIDNAIHWTDDGSDEEKFIWIGASDQLDGQALVIADSGPGFIDPAHEVIEPFFTRKNGGMGIGLYYSDMVMKSHKGRLAFPERNLVERPEKTNGACVAMVFGEEGSK